MHCPKEPKPRTRPLFGGKYPGGGYALPTADWSYWSGFITGRDWDRFSVNNYMPGGPYVSTDYYTGHRDGAWQDFCAASKINNIRWKDGFKDGRAAMLAFLAEYEADLKGRA